MSDFQGFLLDEASSFADDFVSQISDALNIGLPDVTDLSDLIGNISSFASNAFDLISSFADDTATDSEVDSEDTFSGQITGLISSLSTIYDDPSDAYKAQKSLLSFGDDAPDVTETTPSRVQQAANQTAIINLVRDTALSEMIRATSQMDYVSRTDAINVRDELNDLLEPQVMIRNTLLFLKRVRRWLKTSIHVVRNYQTLQLFEQISVSLR